MITKSLFQTIFGLATLCLCFSLMTATPTMAQTAKSVTQVTTIQNFGDDAPSKKPKTVKIGTIVKTATILRTSLNNPKPDLAIASLEVYQVQGGEMVMTKEGCMEDVCEFDIAELPQGLYRVMVRTNHANKSFGKVIHVW